MIRLANDIINNKDIDDLRDWLGTYPRLTKGEVTVQYEEAWAKYIGTDYAVFVNSGSSANLLMLAALKEGGYLESPGQIVVPALSWATDLAPVLQLGMKPILVDCNMKDLSVDLGKLEHLFITHSPSALMLVSVLGLVPDMEEIRYLCSKYAVTLLEDCCESLGSEYKGRKLGSTGLMSSFSTYFGHHISTIEGGMICTDDPRLHDILLMLRSHGWARDLSQKRRESLEVEHNISGFSSAFTFYVPGFNLRSTDLQAFIGLGQLKKLPSVVEARSRNFAYYMQNISDTMWKPDIMYPLADYMYSNFAFPIISTHRNAIAGDLGEIQIECRPLICGSMTNQPFYKTYMDTWGISTTPSTPNADLIDKEGLYVPNHPSLTHEDLDKIIHCINGEWQEE